MVIARRLAWSTCIEFLPTHAAMCRRSQELMPLVLLFLHMNSTVESLTHVGFELQKQLFYHDINRAFADCQREKMCSTLSCLVDSHRIAPTHAATYRRTLQLIPLTSFCKFTQSGARGIWTSEPSILVSLITAV